jgi:hypothetical protein
MVHYKAKKLNIPAKILVGSGFLTRRGGSASKIIGYGLDDRISVPSRDRGFSLRHHA